MLVSFVVGCEGRRRLCVGSCLLLLSLIVGLSLLLRFYRFVSGLGIVGSWLLLGRRCLWAPLIVGVIGFVASLFVGCWR